MAANNRSIKMVAKNSKNIETEESSINLHDILLDLCSKDEIFSALSKNNIDSINEFQKTAESCELNIAAPLGVRPALAASLAENMPVVVIVPSSKDATDFTESLRDWYKGNPQDVAQLEAWETLPHERLSPRADTVASRIAVFRRLKHPENNLSLIHI